MATWAYKNASVRQGDIDGEMLFDFTRDEFGATKAEQDAVAYDLEVVFRHNLTSKRIEIILLTLQELQYLCIKYGDFFATSGRPDAIDHFAGISGGYSKLDSQNGVRVTNMAFTDGGSTVAVTLLGTYERGKLYFGKTMASDKLPGWSYRDVAYGDKLLLMRKEVTNTLALPSTAAAAHPQHVAGTRDIAMAVESRNENPGIQFVVDKKMHAIPVTANSIFYYIAAVTPKLAIEQQLKVGAVYRELGFLGTVQKINPSAPSPSEHYYYQIYSPESQRSYFTVVLTTPPNNNQHTALTMNIGATVAKIAADATSAIKRTAATAVLPTTASTAPAAKIARKTATPTTPIASAVNPVT